MKGVKFLNKDYPWLSFTETFRLWLDVTKGSGIYWEDNVIDGNNVLILRKATTEEIVTLSKVCDEITYDKN